MRETITICGRSAFDQDSNNCTSVFLIQNIQKFLDKLWQPVSEKKGNQWQKLGRKFLLKPAKFSLSSESELSSAPGAKIANEKSVCFRFRRQRCLPVTMLTRFA
jgi:hypothetical protein